MNPAAPNTSNPSGFKAVITGGNIAVANGPPKPIVKEVAH